MSPILIRALFYLSAAYSGSIALISIFEPQVPFQFLHTPAPNHWAYVQFPGAILLIFAIMFLAIARNPVANANLVPYGILLRVACSGVTAAYWYLGGLPLIWLAVFCCEFLMMIAYMFVYKQLTSVTHGFAASGVGNAESIAPGQVKLDGN